MSVVCLGLFGIALARAGTLPVDLPSNSEATTIAQNDELCQTLIENAIQASQDQCENIGPNKVCYGNITLKAELHPNVNERFTERGDVISIQNLLRLSASPLNMNTREWGVAIFKVMANLPGSLPGQTVTMVVFGNTVLENRSDTLEAFYFFSELGRIVCEKAPYDGLLITMPDGAGVQFNINGTDLTLQGNASLTATKNAKMVIALFRGVAIVKSAGREQTIKAGEKVSVPLGGENGAEAIGAPSLPAPVSPDDLDKGELISGLTDNELYDEPGQEPPVDDVYEDTGKPEDDGDNPKDNLG